MTTHPNCKINLGLHVVGRRPDGYHNLETLFLPVHDLCDELEITEAGVGTGRTLSAEDSPADHGQGTPCPYTRLCYFQLVA